jgi:hypothetical protein
LQSVHALDAVQRNGEGPFRLSGPGEVGEVEEVGGCRLPLYPPPGDGPTLPLYPPPGDSTLGKVNIVIFSGIGSKYCNTVFNLRYVITHLFSNFFKFFSSAML